MSDAFDPKRLAWARSKFDVEGLAGALAAWLIGLLLGIVWSPLFWIGAVSAVIILLATRRSNRSGPDEESASLVSPVDGVVVSVDRVSPPSELRLGLGDAVRIRISSSPASQNRVFSPLSGTVATLITESGAESQPVAMDPDAHGLFNAFVALAGSGREVGLRLVTGGLGPRVDLDVLSGDTVAIGGLLGKRRLGGWCDVYVDSSETVIVAPGMTVVGAETRLSLLPGETAYQAHSPVESATVDDDPKLSTGTETAIPASTAAVSESLPEEPEPPAETSPTPGVKQAEPSDPEELDTLTEPPEDDPSEMFAKLRSRVEEASKKDDEA